MKKFSTAAAILFTVLGVFSAQAKLNPEKASKMEYKQFGSQYFIRINPGQELVSTLKEFCKAKKITLATVSGIGSLKSVTLGFFNPESKKYDQKTFNEYMEMPGLTGQCLMKRRRTGTAPAHRGGRRQLQGPCGTYGRGSGQPDGRNRH